MRNWNNYHVAFPITVLKNAILFHLQPAEDAKNKKINKVFIDSTFHLLFIYFCFFLQLWSLETKINKGELPHVHMQLNKDFKSSRICTGCLIGADGIKVQSQALKKGESGNSVGPPSSHLTTVTAGGEGEEGSKNPGIVW